MLDPTNVPPVAPGEMLARYILASKWIANGQVKQDAFVPHPYVELSLTRHREMSSEELWNEGHRVAKLCARNFYGRADVGVEAFTSEDLDVKPDPIDGNANHVNVIKWPLDKHQQKLKALRIAAKSMLIPPPKQ